MGNQRQLTIFCTFLFFALLPGFFLSPLLDPFAAGGAVLRAQTQAGAVRLDEASVPVQFPTSQETENAPNQESTALVSASLYFRVFLILGFLIVLIYFTLKFLRRLSLQKPNSPGPGIQVLSSRVLHGDRVIHVVEVGGECYLLGTGGVQVLDRYTEQERKDRVLLEATQDRLGKKVGPSTLDFVQLVRQRLRKPGHSGGGEGSMVEKGEGEQEIREDDGLAAPVAGKYRQRLRSAAQQLRSQGPGGERQEVKGREENSR